MVPLLDTLLADWYWHYFQQNRWRFMQRTATAEQPGKDFTTWDLPRLFAEIDKQFQKALAAEKILKATPISAWNDLLPKGTMPDSYRPTLYDFIAHEALEFYTSGEQAAAKPEDAFELSADSPVSGLEREVPRLAARRCRRKDFTDSPCSRPSTLPGPAALSREGHRPDGLSRRGPGAAGLWLEHRVRRRPRTTATRRR